MAVPPARGTATENQINMKKLILLFALFASFAVHPTAAQSPQRPIINKTHGVYRIASTSGILTGVAAGTGTAGHVFAWQQLANPVDNEIIIKRIRLRWQTLT